jgi:hypothetical protein
MDLTVVMSAFGPKQTWANAPHMSASGGKADVACYGNPLSRSLLGVKRTCRFAPHMSAFDPKRTSLRHAVIAGYDSRDPLTSMTCAGERFA